MMKDTNPFHIQTTPGMSPASVVTGRHYRIAVLTEGLFRLEYSESGVFNDLATRTVIDRNFPVPDFRVAESEELLEIYTSRLYLRYTKEPFSSNSLRIESISNLSNYDNIWHYGDEVNDLGGTARTLDKVDGPCPLGHGIMSKFGFAVLDDSDSILIDNDGNVIPRSADALDLYFFGYGHDYLECLRVFYHLCGKTPMIPRYALGNWWSRYYEYSEESYCKLMQDFEEEDLPFSVAIIDMDWHLVHIDPKYGSGWTGYTWNRDLFPDPERFIRRLHDQGLKIGLNLHPAAGVRAYEDCYPEFASFMEVDQEAEEPVVFNITDEKFREGYFRYVHHPLERQGIDFWWIDWQQGSQSDIAGMDPLWLLNHYHFLDSGRAGKRSLIFSRYAGPGSHRYPVGFSGDTLTTWESLDFQPYFTANASNIGYGWWSNDIGGHMLGVKDDIMAVRWLQLGVFSPINRLHTAKMLFYGREPWRYGMEARTVMGEFLRLRHRLIPYIYTMNYLAYAEDRPIMLPMYYQHPDSEEAYQYKNQYYFGTSMIVAPITTPSLPQINMGKVSVWLPEGIYHDYFTGMIYQGGRLVDMYRPLSSIPVLIKAGTILPETEELFGRAFLSNPQALTLKIYAGSDGSFTLYEDDNDSNLYRQGEYVKTRYTFDWDGEQPAFRIDAARGTLSLIPALRDYRLEFINLAAPAEAFLMVNGQKKPLTWTWENGIQTITLREVETCSGAEIRFTKPLRLAENDVAARIFHFLDKAEIEYALKDELYYLLTSSGNTAMILNQLQAMNLNRDLEHVLSEIFTARL